MKINLNADEFNACLPKPMQGRIPTEVIDHINAALADQDTAEMIRDNLIGYTHILQEGKFKLGSYIDAVRYVSYKIMGNSNLHAYVKTFPDRYNDFVRRGVTKKDISSYVAAYNKNKLVNLIYEQTLIPTYVLNASNYQEAINTQMEIMRDPQVSPKVRSDAANSILNHLKRPEATKVQLDVTHKDSDSIAELREISRKLAEQQVQLMAGGQQTAKDVAEYRIIQGTCEEVGNEG